jgi:hypothetical protein
MTNRHRKYSASQRKHDVQAGMGSPGRCIYTGKMIFPVKAKAKQWARQLGHGVRAYPCPMENQNHFHVGRLPPEIIHGTMSRGVHYRRGA